MEGLSIFIEQPVRLLQIIVDGILVGSVFALSAYGLALVWGVMKIINIAQGEFVMLGGYVAILIADAGYSPLLGVPLAAMILFCVGWVRMCWRRRPIWR